MSKKFILTISQLFLTCLIFQLNAQIKSIEKLSDAPNNTTATSNHIYPNSYEAALQQWKTVNEINNWIKYNFKYDMGRAKKMAENSLDREKTNIYSPEEFYQIKKGICVDLSRFTVETINKIDTSVNAQYLMIVFEPIIIDGKVIRKHWITVYQDVGDYYLLGDSKRPGHIAGPYDRIDDFIIEYQKYRDRKIDSWKVLSNYRKVRKKKTYRQNRKS